MLLLLLLGSEPPVATGTPGVVSRSGPFGLPIVDIEDGTAVGNVTGLLSAVTATIAGTATPYNFGTVTSSLSAVTTALTGTVANPVPITGSLASTLNAITAALAGAHAAPITGTQASSLNAVTAALTGLTIGGTISATLGAAVSASLGGTATGNDVAGHINNAQLSAVTAALTGTHTPPAVTGTAAGTLSAVTAFLEGQGGTSNLAGDSYPWQKIKKRRERLLAEERALNKKIRQRLGLEPPDPEPESDALAPQRAPEPFYVSPDLGLMPLLERMGQLRGELQGLEAEHDAETAEMALRAILLADDGPSLGEIDIEGLMAKMQAMGGNVLSFAKDLQDLVGAANGATDQAGQVNESLQQMMQGMAQQQQTLVQLGQALMHMIENQNALMGAVKAPRKKSFTVKRGKDGRVEGADMMEEVGE